MLPLIVCTEPLLRLGLYHFLQELKLTNCLQAATAEQALRLHAEHRPALVIISTGERQIDVPRLVRELRRRRREQAVLVISREPRPEHVRHCLEAGVRAYITTEDVLTEVSVACAAVMRGDLHLSRSIVREMKTGHSAPPLPGKLRVGARQESPRESLSSREREVFDLIGGGHGCKEVAGRLGISVKTVETHQQRIKDKLGVGNCAELRRLAEHDQKVGRQNPKMKVEPSSLMRTAKVG
ncbi:MAG: response regulator transcription factor [Prosthecobacter sp.]